MSPNNTTHLPDAVWQQIDKTTQSLHLKRILESRGAPSRVPNNTRGYRQWSAALECIETLLDESAPQCTALITLTTRCTDAKWANKRLSRILEKVIAPYCIKWVRFFHRSKRGYVHWHIVASLKFSILNTDYESWTYGERARRSLTLVQTVNDGDSEIENALSEDTVAMTNRCRAALRKAGTGFVARIEPIIFPDKIGNYAAKYMSGTAKYNRYGGDRGVRLSSVSKGARVANAHRHFITPWSRISRLKNAAYCASQGWRSMEEASRKDPKWQYHARPFLVKKKLLLYLYESDYVSEWGNHWSPCASGVRILYPHVRPGNGMVFQYVHNERPTDVNDLAALQREWDEALPVPLDIWFGKNQ